MNDLKISKEEAVLIRKWRCEEGCTWRRVAEKAYDHGIGKSDWNPPSN